MYSNPKQTGDEDLLMEVDKEPTAEPSVPPWHTHQQTSPTQIHISEQAIRYASEILSANVHPDYDDNRIRWSLDIVWVIVHRVLSQVHQFHGGLANQDEFQNNVKLFGEDKFIYFLKDTARTEYWKGLFEHSTLYLHLPQTH